MKLLGWFAVVILSMVSITYLATLDRPVKLPSDSNVEVIFPSEQVVNVEPKPALPRHRSEKRKFLPVLYPCTTNEIDLGPSTQTPMDRYETLSDLPPRVISMMNTLWKLQETSLRTFESAPNFGNNRAPLGRPPVEIQPPPPERRHSPPLPDRDESKPLRTLEVYTKLASPYWAWFKQMRGMTARGFVYQILDPSVDLSFGVGIDERIKEAEDFGFFVVSDPGGEHPENYLEQVMLLGSESRVDSRERLWDVTELHLVSIIKNDPPAVYLKAPSMSGIDTLEITTRELNAMELMALAVLRSKNADSVIGWDEENQRIQMFSALRAKSACIKCHEVQQNELLGSVYLLDYGSQTASRRQLRLVAECFELFARGNDP